MNTSKRQDDGFSLIELVIALGISAMLIGTVAVFLTSASALVNRTNARAKVVKAVDNDLQTSWQANCGTTLGQTGCTAPNGFPLSYYAWEVPTGVDNGTAAVLRMTQGITRSINSNSSSYFTATKTGKRSTAVGRVTAWAPTVSGFVPYARVTNTGTFKSFDFLAGNSNFVRVPLPVGSYTISIFTVSSGWSAARPFSISAVIPSVCFTTATSSVITWIAGGTCG
jgi:prepilin-type N-terminal cleavage/methylation domain-containing protein